MQVDLRKNVLRTYKTTELQVPLYNIGEKITKCLSGSVEKLENLMFLLYKVKIIIIFC